MTKSDRRTNYYEPSATTTTTRNNIIDSSTLAQPSRVYIKINVNNEWVGGHDAAVNTHNSKRSANFRNYKQLTGGKRSAGNRAIKMAFSFYI